MDIQESQEQKNVEPAGMETESSPPIDRLEISPDLLRAYTSNLGKIIFLFGIIVGGYFLAITFVGLDPFVSMLEEVSTTLGITIPLALILKIFAGIAALILLLVIFQTTALATMSLIFEDDSLKYSYGGFFKVSKVANIIDIVQVNYKEYSLFKTGSLELQLSGTEEKDIKIPFVADVSEKCDLINKLVRFKKSQQYAPNFNQNPTTEGGNQ